MRKDQEDSTGLNVFKCYNGCWAEVGRINFCLLCYNLIVCQEGWVLRPCGGGRGGAGNERPAGNSPSGERICIRPRTHASGRTRREHTRSPICYWIIFWRLQVQQRNTNRSAFKGSFKEFLKNNNTFISEIPFHRILLWGQSQFDHSKSGVNQWPRRSSRWLRLIAGQSSLGNP